MRTYGVIIHVDIKDDKIWIQRDGIEIGIANELMAAGVNKEDIILGFYAHYKGQFTGFAVG
ncbi:MAG: element excision factor XisI family protein [Cuspidothrix sp.]